MHYLKTSNKVAHILKVKEDLKQIKKARVDFLGLNYYSRALIKPYTEGETTLIINNKGKAAKGSSKTILKGWFEQIKDPSSEYTEWDTEIYPKGLYDGLLRAQQRYGLPMYITENGVGMYEDVSEYVEDDYRISFMNDHINAIMNAVDDGADVRGYFAWSTFDLYSWKNGCEKDMVWSRSISMIRNWNVVQKNLINGTRKSLIPTVLVSSGKHTDSSSGTEKGAVKKRERIGCAYEKKNVMGKCDRFLPVRRRLG